MDSNSVSVLVDHFSAFSLVGRARPHTRGKATKRMLAAVFAPPPRVNDDWALNVILMDDTEAAFKVCYLLSFVCWAFSIKWHTSSIEWVDWHPLRISKVKILNLKIQILSSVEKAVRMIVQLKERGITDGFLPEAKGSFENITTSSSKEDDSRALIY